MLRGRLGEKETRRRASDSLGREAGPSESEELEDANEECEERRWAA